MWNHEPQYDVNSLSVMVLYTCMYSKPYGFERDNIFSLNVVNGCNFLIFCRFSWTQMNWLHNSYPKNH